MSARQGVEAALRASEERYRLIVEGARDYAILTTDAEGRITSWSPGAEAVFGWPPGEAMGQPVAITFPPEARAGGAPEAERAEAAVAGVAPDVRWHQRRDGTRVFIEGTMRALADETGMLRGFLKVGQDVTQRRELDAALRASEARYRTLVDNVHDYAIFLLDARGVVTEWTPGAEAVQGYATEEAVGRHLSLFFTPEDVAAGEVDRELAEAAATGRAEREGWRVRKGGERFWVNEVASAVRDDHGRLAGFTKVTRDLTERRLAHEAAERARTEAAREELRRQLSAAEEAERRRLARELHDQLGQQLTAFALGAEDALRLTGASGDDRAAANAPLVRRLAQLHALAREMQAGARYLALELRPPELDDLGIELALETYVREWSVRYAIPADVALTGDATDRPLRGDVGSTLYRIVQEALTNVARHAQAAQVSVIVERSAREVRLLVEDDGRGFDVDATARRAESERRLGLAGMQERAALVGGAVTIESAPGRGTTVYVRLPLGPGDCASRADAHDPDLAR